MSSDSNIINAVRFAVEFVRENALCTNHLLPIDIFEYRMRYEYQMMEQEARFLDDGTKCPFDPERNTIDALNKVLVAYCDAIPDYKKLGVHLNFASILERIVDSNANAAVALRAFVEHEFSEGEEEIKDILNKIKSFQDKVWCGSIKHPSKSIKNLYKKAVNFHIQNIEVYVTKRKLTPVGVSEAVVSEA